MEVIGWILFLGACLAMHFFLHRGHGDAAHSHGDAHDESHDARSPPPPHDGGDRGR